MKMPPLLMGATLVFWGWQSHFLTEGAIMAVILESSWLVKGRLEFTDDEFARVWTFCNVLLLAAVFFAFNDNGGPSGISQLFENLNSVSERNAGNVSTMTADSLIRWLPMIFFLFVVAQVFSQAGDVPLEAVFFLMRNRLKRARKRGQPLPPSRRFNALYLFFVLCLFSAAGHAAQNDDFYYGICVLIAWALWPQRSRRFGLVMWVAMLAIAVTLGYFGQRGFGQLSRLAEEYDPQFLSYFMRPLPDPKRSKTNIGDVGEIKQSGKIVIRLTTEKGAPPPIYLREASYRKLGEFNNPRGFKQLVWDAGNTNNDFPPVSETPPDSGNWPLHPGGLANRDRVNIACYLDGVNREDHYPDGLLPLPADCNRLENLRAYFVYQNSLGTVLAEGPRLMIFDARYGSGMVMDDKPEADEFTTNEDLSVPTNEAPALDEVISTLNVDGKSDDQKILAVQQFFAGHFSYSLWQDPSRSSGTNVTALDRFLLDTRRGHCEYFATATVLLLRELGIPARYAVGYYVHEPSGDGYVVRLRDAHAWCLAWNTNNSCWQNLDTTPASWVKEEAEQSSPLQFLSDFQSWVQYQVLKFFEYSHNNVREYIFWALIPALAFLLYRIFRGSRRYRKEETQSERFAWPGLDSEFYRVEQTLVQNGLPREPGESLSAWLQRTMADAHLAGLRQPLENILRLHYRYRFDPQGLSLPERQMLRREVETVLSSVSRRAA